MRRFQKLFRQIKSRYDRKRSRDRDLICKQGFYSGCAVLKLQKATWTNDDMTQVPNQTGIFFSIWVTPDGIRDGNADYNVHALKVRLLEGQSLTSNVFCDAFRKKFKRVSKSWPDVYTDSGCTTLMEGQFDIDQKTFEDDALQLMDQFQEVSPMIDSLLKKNPKPITKKRR